MADARTLFNEIASWSIEALDEDIGRYFYHFDDVSLIEKGKKNFIIGRKGNGKTAIAEYIRNKNPSSSSARLLSFKNFPFNQIYDLKDERYTSPNQYITVWEYVIYCTICNMMLTDSKVDPLRRKELEGLFQFDIENALSNSIKKISDRGFNINILGVGAGITQSTEGSALDIEARNEILRKYIRQHISKDPYYIIFDALDEDYKGVLQPDRRANYFDLLVGLMKAVQNVRRSLQNSAVAPLVFLRDDIFDLCRDPDKNKWLDHAIVLNWNQANLKNLVAYRLSKAIDPDAAPLDFDYVWVKHFASTVRANRRHQRTEAAFSYMMRFTYSRPRDLVSYVRECAKCGVAENATLISGAMIKEANKGHSDYLRREVIDETYSIIDNISEILDLLAEQRKSIFTQNEFCSIYDEEFYNQKSDDYRLSANEVLRLLYRFNVVGNVVNGSNHQVYSYNSNNKKLNPRENVCVHLGLLKALDVI